MSFHFTFQLPDKRKIALCNADFKGPHNITTALKQKLSAKLQFESKTIIKTS